MDCTSFEAAWRFGMWAIEMQNLVKKSKMPFQAEYEKRVSRYSYRTALRRIDLANKTNSPDHRYAYDSFTFPQLSPFFRFYYHERHQGPRRGYCHQRNLNPRPKHNFENLFDRTTAENAHGYAIKGNYGKSTDARVTITISSVLNFAHADKIPEPDGNDVSGDSNPTESMLCAGPGAGADDANNSRCGGSLWRTLFFLTTVPKRFNNKVF